jgi:hypothetical protein
VALAVSLPFAFEILWRYHLKIVNELPSASPSNLLDLNELPSLARTIALPVAVAALALGLRAARRLNQEMRVTLAFAAVVVCCWPPTSCVSCWEAAFTFAGGAGAHFFASDDAGGGRCGVAIADASAAVVRRLG